MLISIMNEPTDSQKDANAAILSVFILVVIVMMYRAEILL